MNNRDMALLERAFSTEIDAALLGRPRMMQTKATARADALVEQGYLTKGVEMFHGIRIEGYELTHAGRYAFCDTCTNEEIEP